MKSRTELKKDTLLSYMDNRMAAVNNLLSIAKAYNNLSEVIGDDYDKRSLESVSINSKGRVSLYRYLTYKNSRESTLGKKQITGITKQLIKNKKKVQDESSFEKLRDLVSQLDDVIYSNSILNRNIVLVRSAFTTVYLPDTMAHELIISAVLLLNSATNTGFPIRSKTLDSISKSSNRLIPYTYDPAYTDMVKDVLNHPIMPLIKDNQILPRVMEYINSYKMDDAVIRDGVKLIRLASKYVKESSPALELDIKAKMKEIFHEDHDL